VATLPKLISFHCLLSERQTSHSRHRKSGSILRDLLYLYSLLALDINLVEVTPLVSSEHYI